jgi:hypothetical protein
MAFDSRKNVVTLYGGQLQQGDPAQEASYLNDTWEWDGQDWIQQENTGPNRCRHAMAYDDHRQRLVLFGGNDALNQGYGDTWEWDGTTWKQRADFGPPPCAGASLVFTGGECVLFGGSGSAGLQKQTWVWDGTHWTARQDMGPSARSGHAAAFDSVRQLVVLFGGLDQTNTKLGDTWEQNVDVMLNSFIVGHVVSEAGEQVVPMSVTLSGPAPANGLSITFSAPQSSGTTLNSGMQVTVPAGQTTMVYQVTLTYGGHGTPVTFTATLQNGNSLQAVVRVSPNN